MKMKKVRYFSREWIRPIATCHILDMDRKRTPFVTLSTENRIAFLKKKVFKDDTPFRH